MAIHFHSLTVASLDRDPAGSVIINFCVPEALQQLYRYLPGQSISLKAHVNGETLRRSYSICTAPAENKMSIAVKKIDAGKFSAYVNERLQPGDNLDVLPPSGSFYNQPNPSQKKRYLAVAAGSGITPIIAIIKATLAIEKESFFTLVYGNRSRTTIMFFEELEGIKNKYTHRFNYINILSREKTDIGINYGRIDADKLLQLSKLIDFASFQDVFICGPQDMLSCVKDFLKTVGLADNQIHYELFNALAQPVQSNTLFTSGSELQVTSKISILSDGRSIFFELAYNNDSILDAALKQGADLPFACKGGVCSTCRARLIAGKVSMDNNYALEQDEIDAGFILTCQSHPLTPAVSIDFDTR